MKAPARIREGETRSCSTNGNEACAFAYSVQGRVSHSIWDIDRCSMGLIPHQELRKSFHTKDADLITESQPFQILLWYPMKWRNGFNF